MVSVSVIIVTHNREEMLKNLLQSLAVETHSLEVIVINNTEHKLEIDTTHIQLVNKKHPTPGEARNTGLHLASKEWILFLDDDVILPPNYLSKNLEFISQSKKSFDMIGGPDQTHPTSTFYQKCLGLALQSPMATAKTRHRHTKEALSIERGDEKNLILCNLWVNRDFLVRTKILFNKDFFRNEESILITESLRNGAKALYKPDLYVFHSRKSNVFALSRSTFSSGKHRAKSFFFAKELFDPLFLVPSLLVIYLMTLPFVKGFALFLSFPLYVYLILSLLFSLRAAKGNILKAGFTMAYQIQINILYGLGVLYGLTLDRLNISSRLSL
jgi:glycosyltransferase involved in cell wall biosynthesis